MCLIQMVTDYVDMKRVNMRMSKITRCDICGLETVGRNPEGFHEVPLYNKSLYNPDGYSDLCEDCYEEYDKVYDAALRTQRDIMRKWFEEKCLKGANNDIHNN